MKIITQNATEALYEKAEMFNQQSTEGWKCIYFKIPSSEDMEKHSLARFDMNVVTNMLGRMNGFVYLCGDEIFILYHGSYNSLISRLSIYLWSLAEGKNNASFNQPFSIFDLAGQWTSFYRFCQKRYFENLAKSEELAMTRHLQSPVPAELVLNEHVAGYLK